MKEFFWTETGQVIDPVLAAFSTPLKNQLAREVAQVYISGSAQMEEYAKTLGGRSIYFEGPPIQKAIDFANTQCATLVTKMNDETRKLIANTIADSIQNKRGIDGMRVDLERLFKRMKRGDEMSISRARMIARTESNSALSQSFLDRGEALGITHKEWITTNPCDVCVACGAAGVVPMDYDFPHQGMDPKRPPAHPNCRCALAPALAPAQATGKSKGGVPMPPPSIFNIVRKAGQIGKEEGE